MNEIEHASGLFSWEVREGVALLRLKRCVVDFAGDLNIKRDFLSYFTRAEEDRNIRALFLIFSDTALSPERYETFINQLRAEQGGGRGGAVRDVERVENSVRQQILRAARFRKLMISCIQGEVASPFFGPQLAGDLRFARHDTVIRMSHVLLGIPPDGALGYFLPQYLGRGRATEILLSSKPLKALDLLELGLVTSVVSEGDFEEGCIRAAEPFLSYSAKEIRSVKRLMNPYQENLDRYLEGELMTVKRALQTPRRD